MTLLVLAEMVFQGVTLAGQDSGTRVERKRARELQSAARLDISLRRQKAKRAECGMSMCERHDMTVHTGTHTHTLGLNDELSRTGRHKA